MKGTFTGSLGILLITLFFHQSLAQEVFFRYPDNPVLNLGNWDDTRVETPFVLLENETYLMWYSGGDNGYDNPTDAIGYATSPDGESWLKYESNPILTTGPPGSWDVSGISSPSVIRRGNIYYMVYAGTNGFIWRIGLAYSPDKVTWYKYSGNPIFNPGKFGEWDSYGVWDPMLIFDGTEYKLYYTGYDGSKTRIGLATSADGLTWTRAPNNPVLIDGLVGWDNISVANPYVMFDDLEYYIWYSGYNSTSGGPRYNIGLATSTNGYNWEKADSLNPVLSFGEQGSFDPNAVFHPSVLLDKDIFKMWFTGRNNGYTRIGFALPTPLFIDVTPYTTEILPGNFLDLTATVRSTSPDSVLFQMWSDVTLPNGNPYSGNPVLGPYDFEVEPNGTFWGIFSIYVPNQAPPDSGYKLKTKVGNHPRDIWDISKFEFEILPPP